MYVANTAAPSNRMDIKQMTDLSRNGGYLVEHLYKSKHDRNMP